MPWKPKLSINNSKVLFGFMVLAQTVGNTKNAITIILEVLHPRRGAPYVNLRCYSVGPM